MQKGPRPHYLNTNSVIISEDKKSLTGKVHFSSTDETIGDRVDHVNVANCLFATWNCAHALASPFFKGEAKKLRATETHIKSLHVVPPDTDIEVVCVAEINTTDSSGVFNAEYSLNGKLLQQVRAEFAVR
jgi:hypothetical protein